MVNIVKKIRREVEIGNVGVGDCDFNKCNLSEKTFELRLKGGKKKKKKVSYVDIWGRVFLAEETAREKALRWECV